MARRGRPWHTLFGVAAEEHAASWLQARGLTIVARRYRAAHGEIDIVALDGCTLVFVEVRARSTDRWGTAAESVGADKRRRLLSAARVYVRRTGQRRSMRFDLVSVRRRAGRLEVDWIPDAFRP